MAESFKDVCRKLYTPNQETVVVYDFNAPIQIDGNRKKTGTFTERQDGDYEKFSE